MAVTIYMAKMVLSHGFQCPFMAQSLKGRIIVAFVEIVRSI